MVIVCVFASLFLPAGLPAEADIMAGISTDATGISSLQSGLETPDVALNLRKQGDSLVSGQSSTSRCCTRAEAAAGICAMPLMHQQCL